MGNDPFELLQPRIKVYWYRHLVDVSSIYYETFYGCQSSNACFVAEQIAQRLGCSLETAIRGISLHRLIPEPNHTMTVVEARGWHSLRPPPLSVLVSVDSSPSRDFAMPQAYRPTLSTGCSPLALLLQDVPHSAAGLYHLPIGSEESLLYRCLEVCQPGLSMSQPNWVRGWR
jgi:hypothetical protein